jgi:hypothetical protein
MVSEAHVRVARCEGVRGVSVAAVVVQLAGGLCANVPADMVPTIVRPNPPPSPDPCLNANATLATALFQKRALTPCHSASTTLRNAPKFRLAHCEFEHFGCACLCTTWYPAHSHPFTKLHELLARSSYRFSALVLPIGLQWAPVRFLTLTTHQSFVISAASGPLPLIYIAASTPPRNGLTTTFPILS